MGCTGGTVKQSCSEEIGASRSKARVPASILNDPMARAIMEAGESRRGSGRKVLFPVTDSQWAERMESARWLDAFAVGNHGQADHCYHFCCEQRYQHRDGLRQYEVGTNMFGYCVRDTMNDGDGTVFGGRVRPGTTWKEAIEWARRWHAERPTHREVVRGFCWNSTDKCEVFPELPS